MKHIHCYISKLTDWCEMAKERERDKAHEEENKFKK